MLVVRQPGAGVEMEETHRCLFVDTANFDYAEKTIRGLLILGRQERQNEEKNV